MFKSPGVAVGNTTIYAQFPGGVDPNKAPVEINKRQTVFYPSRNFINYITVRGLTLENAATNWAPPTSEQTGVIGTNWSKGWIIENNIVRHSKCSGIALGKYGDGDDNTFDTHYDGKPGDPNPYMRYVHESLRNGWNKATVGSHWVRGNTIYQCEQAGIVGCMGCAFSTIEDNDVHDIDSRHLFSGCEQAGIKLHGPIDVVIRNNHLYRIRGTAGIWLDWMAQGTQVTGNLFHDNASEMGDLYAEANHGPILVSNNLLLSPSAMASNSRGFAGIHNLILGRLQVFHDGRNTPYMKSHSTDTAGFHLCPAGDYRWFNNVFAGQANLGACNISTSEFPSVATGNVYAGGSAPSAFDKDALQVPAFDPGIKLVQKTDGWYLTLAQDKGWKDAVKRKIVTTQSLGLAAIPKMAYENADGSPLAVDTDYFGKKRDERNPFPGPFETVKDGKQEIKVWPK